MMPPLGRPVPRQAGFALLLVLFALVVVTALIAAATTLRERSGWELALALRQARADAAARAGEQWAAWALRPPLGAGAGLAELPRCWTEPVTLTLPGTLAEFAVTVSCQRTPDAAAPVPDWEEGTRRRVVYEVDIQASAGAPGDADRVERRRHARLERCQDAAGPC